MTRHFYVKAGGHIPAIPNVKNAHQLADSGGQKAVIRCSSGEHRHVGSHGGIDNNWGQDYLLLRRRLSGRMPPSARRWPLRPGPDDPDVPGLAPRGLPLPPCGFACLPPPGSVRTPACPPLPCPSLV